MYLAVVHIRPTISFLKSNLDVIFNVSVHIFNGSFRIVPYGQFQFVDKQLWLSFIEGNGSEDIQTLPDGLTFITSVGIIWDIFQNNSWPNDMKKL